MPRRWWPTWPPISASRPIASISRARPTNAWATSAARRPSRRKPSCWWNVPAERRPETTPRPATARVFFALWPSAAVAARLADIALDAATRFGGRPTRRETIHLTLAFLGDVPASRLAELGDVAAAVRGAAFDLQLDRLGFWQHNHLLWAGGDMPAALETLHGALSKALSDNGFNIDGGGRSFAPHVTLVRKLPPASGLAAGQAMPLPALAWPCRQFALVRSRLSPSGSGYQILREFPLFSA